MKTHLTEAGQEISQIASENRLETVIQSLKTSQMSFTHLAKKHRRSIAMN